MQNSESTYSWISLSSSGVFHFSLQLFPADIFWVTSLYKTMQNLIFKVPCLCTSPDLFILLFFKYENVTKLYAMNYLLCLDFITLKGRDWEVCSHTKKGWEKKMINRKTRGFPPFMNGDYAIKKTDAGFYCHYTGERKKTIRQ